MVEVREEFHDFNSYFRDDARMNAEGSAHLQLLISMQRLFLKSKQIKMSEPSYQK